MDRSPTAGGSTLAQPGHRYGHNKLATIYNIRPLARALKGLLAPGDELILRPQLITSPHVRCHQCSSTWNLHPLCPAALRELEAFSQHRLMCFIRRIELHEPRIGIIKKRAVISNSFLC